MSLKPSLPVEILDQILYLLRDDILALRASADVNQSFADIVEKHLYHHVTLGGSEMTAAQLSKLLVDSPHIVTYIRSLQITLSSNNTYSNRRPLEQEFAPILPRLLHLTALSLHAENEYSVAWPKLHLKFQSSFLACIRSPTLVNVSISWVTRFPLSLLEESPQLKSLSLIGSFPSSPLLKQGVVTFPHLRSLTIETSLRLLYWLDEINISQLRSIVVWMPRGATTNSIEGILTISSKTLTYLEFHSPFQGQINDRFIDLDQLSPSASPLDLSVIPHLQDLHFGVEIFCTHYFGINSDNPWITQSLQTLFKLPTISLQSIILDIALRVPKIDFRYISWGPLVDTLQKIDSLKRVELRLTRERSMPVDYEFWAIDMLKSDIHLVRLIDTGLLLFTKSKRETRYS